MGKLRKVSSWAFTNLGSFTLVGGWIVSAGFFPALLTFSEGVEPWGYGAGAVAGVMAFFAIRTLVSKRADLEADRLMKARMSFDSSPFDPMDTVYRDKRLHLKDLAPLGRVVVAGKHFINCEIIGPGNAVLSLKSNEATDWPDMRENRFNDINLIQIAEVTEQGGPTFFNTVQFIDCHFIKCQFYTLNLFFFKRDNPYLNWITPEYADIKLLGSSKDEI